MSRDYEFFAVGAAECRSLAWEIYNDDTGVLIGRFDPGAGQPGNLYALLPYHFPFDGRFRVVMMAALTSGGLVTRERIIDTCRETDREIDFHIREATGSPVPGWEEKARRRTDGNLRGVFE